MVNSLDRYSRTVSHICARVDDILSGKSEADKVLHNDASPEHGFVLIPDMKWDLTTLSALYLVAIVRSPDIRSLRDLRRRHLGLLYTIRDTAVRAAHERWGMEPGSLRMFVHYQPSYCMCQDKVSELLGILTTFRPLPCTCRKCELPRNYGFDCWTGALTGRHHISGERLVD